MKELRRCLKWFSKFPLLWNTRKFHIIYTGKLFFKIYSHKLRGTFLPKALFTCTHVHLVKWNCRHPNSILFTPWYQVRTTWVQNVYRSIKKNLLFIKPQDTICQIDIQDSLSKLDSSLIKLWTQHFHKSRVISI